MITSAKEQNTLEIVTRAFAECSTSAELRYVAQTMSDFAPDEKCRSSIADLLRRHMYRVPSSYTA